MATGEQAWLEERVIRITDAHDLRLAPYRNVRERDLVGREGRFIAEGKVVLNVLLANAAFAVESLLVLENRLAGLTEQIRLCPDDVPVYCVSRETMDAIAGFPMHRGILAVGSRTAPAPRRSSSKPYRNDRLPLCFAAYPITIIWDQSFAMLLLLKPIVS